MIIMPFGQSEILFCNLHNTNILNFSFKGLAKYTDLFLRHEIDIQTFSSLTEQDLKEIGITTFGARKKLLLLSNSKSID